MLSATNIGHEKILGLSVTNNRLTYDYYFVTRSKKGALEELKAITSALNRK